MSNSCHPSLDKPPGGIFMQIQPVWNRMAARAANVGAQVLGATAGMIFCGGIMLAERATRPLGNATSAEDAGQGLRSRTARFAGNLASILRPRSQAARTVKKEARPEDSEFYDPGLNNHFPLEGDPRHDFHSDAGLTVSYRGMPEIWTGPTADVVSAIPRRKADGTLVPHVIGQTAQMGEAEALQALETAKASWKKGEWKKMTLSLRCNLLEKSLDEVAEKRSEIVDLLMHEIGKPQKKAEEEFDRTMEYMRSVITCARQIEQDSQKSTFSDAIKREYRVLLRPKGINLVMGPSNYPWNEGFGTTAFVSLVAGNTMIYKPPRMGQLCFQSVLNCFAEHLPPGTINLISGDGGVIIPPLQKSGKIKVLNFIGSKNIGTRVLEAHTNKVHLTPILGTGSKNPMIVLSDADIEKTAQIIVDAAFGNRGERCTANPDVYVPREMADRLVEAVVKLVEKRVAGMPWDSNVSDTPFGDKGVWKRIQDLILNAQSMGAQVKNFRGGHHNGHIVIPAVLYPATFNMDVATKEIFGPLLSIYPYDDIKEVMEHVTHLSEDLGLNQQASVITAEDRKIPQDLLEELSLLYAAVIRNGHGKRFDDDWDLSFGARDEVPLGGANVALRAMSAEVLVYD